MPNLGFGVSVGNTRIPYNPHKRFCGGLPRRLLKDTSKRRLFYEVDLNGVPSGSTIWIVDSAGILHADVEVPSGRNKLLVNLSALRKGIYEVRYWRRYGFDILPQREIIVILSDPATTYYGTAEVVSFVGSYVGQLMPPIGEKNSEHEEQNDAPETFIHQNLEKNDNDEPANPGRKTSPIRAFIYIFALLFFMPLLSSQASSQLVAYSSPEAPIYKDERTTIIARYTDMFSAREDTVRVNLGRDSIYTAGPYMLLDLPPPSFPDYDTVYITIDVRDSIGGYEVHRTTTAPQPTCNGPPGFSYGVTAPVVVPCLRYPDIKAYSIPLKVCDLSSRRPLTADSLEALLLAYDGGVRVGDSVIERVEDVSLDEGGMRESYGSLVLNTSMTGVDFADIDSAKIIITSLRDRRYKKLITLISPSIRTPISWQDSLNSLVIIGGYYLRGPPFITRFGYATDTLTLTSSVKELEKNQSRYIMRVYPNPVEGKSYVYFLGDISTADIKIYDIRGRLINILHPFGSGKYLWDLRDFMGKDVGNGVYIIKSGRNSQKVIIRR